MKFTENNNKKNQVSIKYRATGYMTLLNCNKLFYDLNTLKIITNPVIIFLFNK